MDIRKAIPKFNFRDEVKDSITGFQGKILCIAVYDTGSIHYSLQRPIEKGEKVPEWEGFDESRLVLVKAAQQPEVIRKTSGPVPRIHGN
jgi:hypothetical protein